MKTTGNTVFISGGSAGIGLAIAKKLQAAGNKIIINGRNEERLQKALAELKDAVGIQGDLSVEADRLRIAEELKTNHSDVNVIINNAGAAFSYLLSETKNAHEKALIEMNTNYIAVIHFTELLLPHLLQKDAAAVINVSSMAVYGSIKLLPTYGATKAALHSYTVALRMTYEEQKNIQIYEVYPPLVNTEFSAEIGGGNGIPPSEVADELFIALEKDQFDVPVGETKKYAAAIQEAMSKLNA
ncbi:SDR family oxidoreductase [Bacteroides reticulotermitis]|uniref:3-oxoacyl-[acyl-carrier protein] reductase n=2 Tax=Bacteroides reticulotermitis TaxID=1133319 RepID=W4USN5_9BACE|nr:SDR family NAD(P)-dependent oxidoreductase [Bacteroides reticulotermitis]MBB4043502.1 putative oxidoreductase [Bacteroides reticulotermitis]GAE83524.1 3-oxoacyl-[acyl-carrier protein] reductase [Bacteroides reticulotermitis JCM 10512]